MSGALDPESDARRRARLAWEEARGLGFVCLGNICRSPFAAKLAIRHLPADRRITSAGYYPDPGRRSPRDAIAAARAFGVDLTRHRSRVLTQEMLEEADAVFVFDEHNHRAVLAADPSASGRVHFLGALSDDGPLTIADPYGATARGYERTYGQIAAAIGAAEGLSLSQTERLAHEPRR